jgi:hypothetical protein
MTRTLTEGTHIMTSTTDTMATVTAPIIPAQRDGHAVTYFTGKSPEYVTETLRNVAGAIVRDTEKFGAMLIEAFQMQVHVLAGQSWADYTNDVLGGFKADNVARGVLVVMMRKAGMPHKDVAAATGASEKTVKRDAAKAEITDATRSAGQKSRTDTANGTAKPSPADVAASNTVRLTSPAERASAAMRELSATVRDMSDAQLKSALELVSNEMTRRQDNGTPKRTRTPRTPRK